MRHEARGLVGRYIWPWVVISRQMRDYFDAIAYWRSLVLVVVTTPELLRHPMKRSHRGHQERLLLEVRAQLRIKMREAVNSSPAAGDFLVTEPGLARGHNGVADQLP
jgi:hypothetical protein